MSFVFEFYRFIRQRRKFWLVPVMVAMLAIGGLLVFAQGSAVAPFIYTMF